MPKKYLFVGGALTIIIVITIVVSIFLHSSIPNTPTPIIHSDKIDEENTSCDPNEIIFSDHFTNTDAITSIVPPVWTTASKILNYTALINTTGRVPVYLPAKGELIQGSHYDAEGVGHYLLDFQLACNLVFRFDHISEPLPEIVALLPTIPKSDSRTTFFNPTPSFKAGQLIGYTTGTVNAKNWNVGVYIKNNNPSSNKNFDDLSNYICPFDNYPTDVQPTYTNKFGPSGDAVITSSLCSE